MNPRSVLRIARWETTRSAGDVDRRTAVGFVVVLLVLAALVPALVAYGPTPGEGIYRVGVADDSEYRPVVASDPSLVVAGEPTLDALESGRVDVAVVGGRVGATNTPKGRAAFAAFRSATVSYNDAVMAREDNESAAFPVLVSLTYADQSVSIIGAGPDGGDSSGGDTGEPSGDEADAGTAAGTDSDAGGTDGSGDGSGDGGGVGTGDGVGNLPSSPSGGLGGVLGDDQTGTPSSLSPPFPLRSLVLAFAFLLPLNVVIQAYGSSVLAERINRRGEPLLVAPVSRGDVVAGKTLPYLGGALALIAGIAVAVDAGPLAVLAVAPLAALFLAATFLGAMLARSYKELTFVTVTISVSLTAYAFVPAVFAEVHPIAAISPLTVVVNSITGEGTTLGAFTLSTVPPALAAGVMFGLGAGVYREEDMFTQRPIPAKLLDALAAPLHSRLRVGVWTALFVPFVFVAELFAVAVLFVAPVELSVPLLLASVATIEEVAKSLHVFAGFERGRFPRTVRASLAVGAFSGVGFFLAEKLLLLTQLVGLPGLEVAQFAFSPSVVGLPPGVLLVAPLVLHVVTACISALGAARGRLAYVAAVLVAVLVHVAYNVAVVVGFA